MTSLESVHVLLVDDDTDTCEMYAYALTAHGARITTASSVRDALARFRREPPDILVTDISLDSDEDGYALVEAIRALDEEQGGAVPAVALTGSVEWPDERRTLAKGFTAHCRKPCTPDDLADVLARQLESARRRR